MSNRELQRFERRIFSVFIGNIPARANWRKIWDFLEKRVNVVDVYLSKKTDLVLPRFAFVRFRNLDEAARCIRVFQNSFFLGNLLSLSHAKDGDGRQFCRRIRRESVPTNPTDVSCLDSQNKPLSVSRAAVFEDPDFTQVLLRSVVGKCSKNANLVAIQSELCGKRNLDVVLRLLTDKEVLVEFKSGEAFAKESASDFLSLRNCFVEVSLWNDSVEKKVRETWLMLSGLPPRYWGSKSFDSIASIWGELSGFSSVTANGLDLRYGFIQIKTSKTGKIDEIIELYNGDEVFKIKVCEIPGCVYWPEFGIDYGFNSPVPVPVKVPVDLRSELEGRSSSSSVGVQSPLLASSNETGDSPEIGIKDAVTAGVDSNTVPGNLQVELELAVESAVEPVCMQAVLEPGSDVEVGPGDVVAQMEGWGVVSHQDGVASKGVGPDGICGPAGSMRMCCQAVLDEEDPFGLMEIINRLSGAKNKSKKRADKGSKVVGGDHLGWESCTHVALVEFGPSDANLDEDCADLSNNLAQSRPWSNLFSACNSGHQARANSKHPRVRKGAYGIIGDDRVKTCMYVGKLRRKHA